MSLFEGNVFLWDGWFMKRGNFLEMIFEMLYVSVSVYYLHTFQKDVFMSVERYINTDEKKYA